MAITVYGSGKGGKVAQAVGNYDRRLQRASLSFAVSGNNVYAINNTTIYQMNLYTGTIDTTLPVEGDKIIGGDTCLYIARTAGTAKPSEIHRYDVVAKTVETIYNASSPPSGVPNSLNWNSARVVGNTRISGTNANDDSEADRLFNAPRGWWTKAGVKIDWKHAYILDYDTILYTQTPFNDTDGMSVNGYATYSVSTQDVREQRSGTHWWTWTRRLYPWHNQLLLIPKTFTNTSALNIADITRKETNPACTTNIETAITTDTGLTTQVFPMQATRFVCWIDGQSNIYRYDFLNREVTKHTLPNSFTGLYSVGATDNYMLYRTRDISNNHNDCTYWLLEPLTMTWTSQAGKIIGVFSETIPGMGGEAIPSQNPVCFSYRDTLVIKGRNTFDIMFHCDKQIWAGFNGSYSGVGDYDRSWVIGNKTLGINTGWFIINIDPGWSREIALRGGESHG